MVKTLSTAETVSVTEASERGVSAIVRSASEGRDILVERRGRPVAAVIGMHRLLEIQELERDLRSATLAFCRLATDTGRRTSLDAVITSLGFDRAELEAELDSELAAQTAALPPSRPSRHRK